MKIPSEFVQQLKGSLNIAEVAGSYMRLQRKGRGLYALCPFHTEKTPSFSVNDQLQIFHCFGCGKSGDVITLVMEMEHLSYADTIRVLADRAGLHIPQADPEEDRRYRNRKTLLSIQEEALRFFEQRLSDPGAEIARAYLHKRQIAPETIRTFCFGYAPDAGFALYRYLRDKGFGDSLLLESGLVKRSERTGNLYDAFRNRLMVPIRDLHGQVMAFGGRILGDGEPKYLNSPETSVYRKGFHLFGLDRALEEIRRRDEAVLVEGYYDMIVPFQEGLRNVVASLGTSLTTSQIQLLGRFTRNVVICFDPDAAGSSAARRSVELFLERDFHCRVATLPGGHDPDTFVLEQGEEAFRDVLRNAAPFLDFLLQKALEAAGSPLTPERTARVLEEVFPFLLKITAETTRADYLARWASRLGVDSDALFRQFNRFAGSRQVSAEQVRQFSAPRISTAEQNLIRYLLALPEMANQLFPDDHVTFDGFPTSNILFQIARMARESGTVDPIQLETQLSEHDLIVLHHIQSKEVGIVSEDEARNCFLAIRGKQIETRRARLNRELQEAERDGNLEKCRALLATKRDLDQEVARLHAGFDSSSTF